MTKRLNAAITAMFGNAGAAFLVEAPGRVNLMGDHIDYLGFDVLPMALSQRIRLFARARDDGMVRVISTARGPEVISFTPGSAEPSCGNDNRNMSTAAGPARERASGHWSDYVVAAIHGLFNADRRVGFDAVVQSDLPEAAGLSSSSALVVAAALAYLRANGDSIDPVELANQLATAERYVGTQGGGMDQAVCLLARAGAAARIGFAPLRVTHVPIPPAWRFIVANSLERAEKSGAAQAVYNQRAREAGEALAHVRALLTHDTDLRISTRQVGTPNGSAMLEAGRRVLHGDAFRRFRHTITEARRVDDADAALRSGDATRFGMLMDESHASLRDDFAVSTPSLDALVTLLRQAGAHGARLTGAGLGGCVVALCPVEPIDFVLDALDRQYYGVRTANGAFDHHRFVAVPSAGARVISLCG